MSRPGCGRQRGGSPKLASRQRPSPSSSAGVSRGEAVDREPTRARTPVILVASDVALPAAHRVWGTGGWLPPEEREALDWLTLSRLLGWRVTVARPSGAGLQEAFAAGGRCVVLAGPRGRAHRGGPTGGSGDGRDARISSERRARRRRRRDRLVEAPADLGRTDTSGMDRPRGKPGPQNG